MIQDVQLFDSALEGASVNPSASLDGSYELSWSTVQQDKQIPASHTARSRSPIASSPGMSGPSAKDTPTRKQAQRTGSEHEPWPS
jgi:hypothetical protein